MDVTRTCRDIDELNPVAQEACRLFLEECEAAGLDVFITETYRSQARQNYLYEQGRTRPGPKVTWTRNSNHKSRMAWDIAVSPPKNLYDASVLKKAGAIAKRLGITWGGDWRDSPDMPHFEVKANWKVPKQSVSAAKDKPTDDKLYRVVTGTFKDVKSQKQAIKNLLTLFKNAYPYDTTGLRAITGTFKGRASAEAAAAKIKAKFGYVVYIKEA
ncbi:MAG: M15 family metallopeptidase [Bacillus sp. (in: firmicutes)]